MQKAADEHFELVDEYKAVLKENEELKKQLRPAGATDDHHHHHH